MAIFEGSRYALGENGEKITASRLTINGRTITFLHDRRVYTEKDMREAIQVYQIEVGDLPDLVAFIHSGSSVKWFLFADLNKMFYPDDEMDQGRVILMPSLTDFRAV